MPEVQPQPVFELDLGDKGSRLVFKTSDELRQWNENERNKWQWVNDAGRPITDNIVSDQNTFYNQVQQMVTTWNSWAPRPTELPQNVFANLKHIFDQNYKTGKILNSSSPAAAFIFELRGKRGDRVAAGAYAVLIGGRIQTGGATWSECFEGIVEGFLFKREIDWAATGHQQVLNALKNQYETELTHQNERFKELEAQNGTLNGTFSNTLKERSEGLTKLHQDQAAEFKQLLEKHVENLTAIEKTYDQKLALQKPVDYWQEKGTTHNRWAVGTGIASFIALLALAGGLARGVFWMLSTLKPGENPKHWQIGVLVVAAFFSVWLLRVLVRLFLSHLHLAADAAERKTMILTYLSMSREGAQFAPEDKTLIVQHLFRTTSDGLVKDDAAPPNLLEIFTRRS